MSLVQEAVLFGALGTGLAMAALWRWRHADPVAAEGGRAGLWLLVVSAAGLVLQLAGVV